MQEMQKAYEDIFLRFLFYAKNVCNLKFVQPLCYDPII